LPYIQLKDFGADSVKTFTHKNGIKQGFKIATMHLKDKYFIKAEKGRKRRKN
jgi:hypothetical protein